MVVSHVVETVVVKLLPRADKFRIVRIKAQRKRERLYCIEGQSIEFVIRLVDLGHVAQGMGVVINRFDLIDFSKELGIGVGLSRSCERGRELREQSEQQEYQEQC